jgi:hypothetical protein
MPAAIMQIIDTVDSAMLSTILICSEDTASSTPSLAQRDNPLALCVTRYGTLVNVTPRIQIGGAWVAAVCNAPWAR